MLKIDKCHDTRYLSCYTNKVGIMSFFDSSSGAILECYLSLYDELLTIFAIVVNNRRA